MVEGEAVRLVLVMDLVLGKKRVREVSIYTDNQVAIMKSGTDAPGSTRHIIDMIPTQHRRLTKSTCEAESPFAGSQATRMYEETRRQTSTPNKQWQGMPRRWTTHLHVFEKPSPLARQRCDGFSRKRLLKRQRKCAQHRRDAQNSNR